MTDLVLYYTRTKNTEIVAKTISEVTNAKVVEIVDRKNRDGPIQYMIGAFDAMRGKDTSIKYEAVDLSEYDTVYIGTPVWASKPAPAINKFIEQNDFTGVNVVVFATMGSSGGDSTTKIMANMISNKGGNVIRSFALAVKNNDIKELTLSALKE